MRLEIGRLCSPTTTLTALLIFFGGASLSGSSVFADDDFSGALQNLRSVEAGAASQAEIQQSWEVVAAAEAAQLTTILQAMHDVGPLAENWLRAAVDTIAERELRRSRALPTEELQRFVLDANQAPRARRTAYEWLAQVDPAAPERLLPQLLEDESLELRHDAVARLLAEADQAGSEEVKRGIYRRALKAARGLSQTKVSLQGLKLLGESPDLNKHFGYITTWQVLGPFDNRAGDGFARVYPPEEEIDLTSRYQGKSGPIEWRQHNTTAPDQDTESIGRVDLNEVLMEEKGVAAYLAATFISPRDQELQCRYGTVNATKLWVNGQLLLSKNIYHMGGEFDQYVASAKFRRGENTILLKVCQNEQTESWARPWDVRLRVTDHLGGGLNSESLLSER